MSAARTLLLALTCAWFSQEVTAARGRPRGWAEVMGGWNTPAGNIGLAGGVSLGKWVRPTVALGFGAAEGMDLSLGNEFRSALNRKFLFKAWVYWTMGLGKRDVIADDHYYTTGRSQLLKAGVSFIFPVRRVDIELGGGYSWFLQRGAVIGAVPTGEKDLSKGYVDDLRDAFIVRIGIGFNMRMRRCGN